VSREFVVTGCDASPVLQAAEHALDEITLAIGDLVGVLRVGLFGMTGTVPRSRRKRRSPSLSQAASAARQRPRGTALIKAVATRTSPRWPGVTSMAIGRPRESTMAWIFVVRPPRERPIACASAPLFRPPPNGRAVEGLTIAGISVRERFKQLSPNPSHRPAAEPIVDRRGRTVDGRAILPPASGLQNMNDSADHPQVVRPVRSRLVWKKRFDRPHGANSVEHTLAKYAADDFGRQPLVLGRSSGAHQNLHA
jgi:hypothetical protein